MEGIRFTLLRIVFFSLGLIVTISANSTIVTAVADCNISAYTPTSSANENCVGVSTSSSEPVYNQGETVEFSTHSAQASYALSVADYGHLGAAVTTYAQSQPQPFGYGLSASSYVGLTFTDIISIASATLPYGTPVSLTLSYRVVGDAGANTTGFGYNAENAFARASGSLTLGNPGEFTTAYSSFCVSTASEPDCAGPFSSKATFEVLYSQAVTVYIGLNYQLHGLLQLQTGTNLVLNDSCPNDFCDAGAYIDASHSFFAYLNPNSNEFKVISESGHDYTISAVPEGSTLILTVYWPIVTSSDALRTPRLQDLIARLGK